VVDEAPIQRPAARILLINDQDRVLLLRANVAEGDVWITPGGALEPGETAEDAALRELREETGIETTELSPCVWTRVHRFEWGGQRYEQREQFFVARAVSSAISLGGCGDAEREFLSEWRWWAAEEIAESDAVFAPRTLTKILPAILACEYPDEPIALDGGG
jgi:8-oxo-dGTP pyrophosphatase MutT (NUDIX family)